mmetsp:Transcript_38677/g.90427  ORF Transcript_38677/g.90427 Transcript_38677/m.90427 type:complete len:226 (-) Transcript_38677:803-1480(-)
MLLERSSQPPDPGKCVTCAIATATHICTYEYRDICRNVGNWQQSVRATRGLTRQAAHLLSSERQNIAKMRPHARLSVMLSGNGPSVLLLAPSGVDGLNECRRPVLPRNILKASSVEYGQCVACGKPETIAPSPSTPPHPSFSPSLPQPWAWLPQHTRWVSEAFWHKCNTGSKYFAGWPVTAHRSATCGCGAMALMSGGIAHSMKVIVFSTLLPSRVDLIFIRGPA